MKALKRYMHYSGSKKFGQPRPQNIVEQRKLDERLADRVEHLSKHKL